MASNCVEADRGLRGIFSGIKNAFRHNRIGDLIVASGGMAHGDLRAALREHAHSAAPLGRFLIERGYASRRAVYGALFRQGVIRSLAAFSALFLSLSAFSIKSARAGSPADGTVIAASFNQNALPPITHYPEIFGYAERRSTEMSAFTKWQGMLNRLEGQFTQRQHRQALEEWQNDLAGLRGASLERMAAGVNDLMNRYRYIRDENNWRQSDYWATPLEFFRRGGDCEDFAVAKYVSLSMLGVPDERMRIAVVHDKVQNIPHAVLVVYTQRGPVVLDNQVAQVSLANTDRRYKPIFSINTAAWWYHSAPAGNAVVASSR